MQSPGLAIPHRRWASPVIPLIYHQCQSLRARLCAPSYAIKTAICDWRTLLSSLLGPSL